MKTYKIELTDAERRALSRLVERGWDYLLDGDYFDGLEEEQPIYEAARDKIDYMKPEEQ